jgi:hypothetical protein
MAGRERVGGTAPFAEATDVEDLRQKEAPIAATLKSASRA